MDLCASNMSAVYLLPPGIELLDKKKVYESSFLGNQSRVRVSRSSCDAQRR